MIDLQIGQREAGDPTFYDSLASIKEMIEMDVEVADVGWSEEPARLFSIDAAMIVLSRHATRLGELERQGLALRLQEARRLVVSERENELDFLQKELEPCLAGTHDVDTRSVWHAAMNAMLPSPFRAAEAVVATALQLDGDDPRGLIEILRDRLRARMGEGTLMAGHASASLAGSA